jgi:uncharacterized protein YqeY
MSLEIQINEQIKTAMLARDEKGLRALRAIKAAILVAKTSGTAAGEMKTEDEIKLLQKLVKSRKDSLEIFQQQNREDLAKKESEEIEVIEKFLPQQMSESELKEAITAIIAAVGATGVGDLGKVMGAANKQLAGKTDGKAISSMVKQLLSN